MRRWSVVFIVAEQRRHTTAPLLSFCSASRAAFGTRSNSGGDACSTSPGSGRCVTSVSQRNSSDTTAEEGPQSQVWESEIPEHMILDWCGGSTYYFSEQERKRLCPSNSSRSPSGDRSTCRPFHASRTRLVTEVTENKDDDAAPVSKAVIHGVARSFTVDLSIPPVRKEEMERWKLDSYLFNRGLNITGVTAQSCKQHYQLLPSTAMVTYLGPEMRKIDQLHRQKGFFTPSEVAEVFIPLVPTFPVESRHVMALVPSFILKRIENAARMNCTLAQVVFENYPMLFHFSPSRYRRALVQLNSEFWFVRQHPGYGKADRILSKYRSHSPIAFDAIGNVDNDSGVEPLYAATAKAVTEGAPSIPGRASGAVYRRPWGVEMLAVLVRNLPRVPTTSITGGDTTEKGSHPPTDSGALVRKRYEPMNLVGWISSFPPNDLAFVNKVHEKFVVQLITQYVHVFQLMSLKKGDHNLFVGSQVLLAGGTRSGWKADTAAPPAAAPYAMAENDNSEDIPLTGDFTEEVDEVSPWWSFKAAEVPHKGDPDEPPPVDSAASTSSDRERVFQQAVTEELIGLDAIADEQYTDVSVLDSKTDGADLAAGPDEVGGTVSGLAGTRWLEEENANPAEIAPAPRVDVCNLRYAPSARSSSSSSPLQQHLRGVSMEEVTAFGLALEEVYVRRLPPDVAPRSLSDLDETTSPDPELIAIAASFLASPPSLQSPSVNCIFRRSREQLQKTMRPVDEVWRWVAVQRLYAAFTTEQRRHLRERYRGLVGFLRYHGKLFELSADLMYVIAHDPRGTMAPFPPLERGFRYANRVVLPGDFDDNPERSASLVGETERTKFSRVLGEGTIPTHRRHLLLLDPDNPLMQHEVLYDEIANLLPDHPMPLAEVMPRLPPVIRAALPHTINIAASKSLETYMERGRTMVRKRTSTQPGPTAVASGQQMSVEEAIAELLQLPIGADGVSVKALLGMHLSVDAAATLADHFGSVGRALRMLPQYFEVWEIDNGGRKKMSMVRVRQ